MVYRYHPGDEPIVGRDDVVDSWLGAGDFPDASDRDEPGTFDASYRAVAVDGDTAVAVGTSTYSESPGGPVAKTFDNCFVMRFDDAGRCREFTEWYVERKDYEAHRPSTIRSQRTRPSSTASRTACSFEFSVGRLLLTSTNTISRRSSSSL